MYGDSYLKYLKGDGTDICGLHQYEKLHMQFPVTMAQTNEHIDEGKRSPLIIEKKSDQQMSWEHSIPLTVPTAHTSIIH